MKVFLVGGTGVIGKRLVPLLMNKGYEVTVLCRSEKNKEFVTKMGAKPVMGNIFDEKNLVEVSKGSDIFLHMATAIPSKGNATYEDWIPTMKLRTEGVKNLINAAIKNSGKFYLQQSTVFHYGHRNGDWVNENTPISSPVKGYFPISEKSQEIADNNVVMENLIQSAIKELDLPAAIIRFGWFYSHDSSNVNAFFNREFKIINEGQSYINLVHVDDAVNAIVAVLENYQNLIGRTVNAVDDYPVKWEELLNYSSQLSSGINADKLEKKILDPPSLDHGLNFILNSVRVNNSLLKELSGWQPRFENYKMGLDYEFEQYHSKSSEKN